jgi:formylglycine-generating enzyme
MKTVLFIAVFVFWIDVVSAQTSITNSIGMEFVLIEPGKIVVGKFQPPYPVPEDTVKSAKREVTMWMGDGRSYDESEFALAKELALRDTRPGFEVAIAKQFYIGKFEVTQGQWKKVMGTNPSAFTATRDADSHPVENVTWKDARQFIKRLNRMEKGKHYRLPSEFEWEYAARAGRENDIPWNEITATAQLGTKTTMPVGGKKPNAWGLYDVLGNVWEWVQDCYNEKVFADPHPPKNGREHVLKGASFAGDVKNATYMTHAAGPGNGWDVGFRVVLGIE